MGPFPVQACGGLLHSYSQGRVNNDRQEFRRLNKDAQDITRESEMNNKLNSNLVFVSVTTMASLAAAVALALKSATMTWFETMFQASQIFPG